MPIFLSQRQKRIIQLLSSHPDQPLVGDLIASHLHISLRTVRSEIKKINDSFGKTIILSDNLGYHLKESQLTATDFQPEEQSRAEQIIKLLLDASEPVPLEEAADSLYISSSALVQSLHDIEVYLKNFHLRLQRKQQSLLLEGSEFDKRELKRSLIYSELNPLFVSLESLSEQFDRVDLIGIKDIVYQAIKKQGFVVDDTYGMNLVLNIVIAFDRIARSFHIDGNDFRTQVDSAQIEYQIAKTICLQVQRIYNIEINETDILYIAILIFGQIKPELESQHTDQAILPFSEDFANQIRTLLTKTFNYYMLNIDFEEFLYNFVLHIDGLIKRSRANTAAHNRLVDSLKMNCPFIYDIAVYLCNELTEQFAVKIPDTEIGFIAIHLGFAIEHSAARTDKLNTLIICDAYDLVRDNLLRHLRENYNHQIEIVSVLSNLSFSSFYSDCDLIISTISNDVPLANTLTISPLFTRQDERKLNAAIETLSQKKKRANMQQMLLACFHETLFFKNVEVEDSTEAIRFLAQKAIDFGLTDDSFLDSVLKRESLSSTCFFDSFSIPHAIELNAYHTMFIVLINDKPIAWDQHKIHLVFMIAVKREDRKAFMELYDGITQILCDIRYRDRLQKSSNFDEFIGFFAELLSSS